MAAIIELSEVTRARIWVGATIVTYIIMVIMNALSTSTKLLNNTDNKIDNVSRSNKSILRSRRSCSRISTVVVLQHTGAGPN